MELPDWFIIYQVRHGEALGDRANNYRDLASVNRRLQVASDTTVKRYEAHARVQKLVSLLPRERQAQTLRVETFLEACLCASLCPSEAGFSQATQGRFAIELFSGSFFSQVVVSLRIRCLAFDTPDNENNGAASEAVQKWLRTKIVSDQMLVVLVGIPCNTWSLAHYRPNGPHDS